MEIFLVEVIRLLILFLTRKDIEKEGGEKVFYNYKIKAKRSDV